MSTTGLRVPALPSASGFTGWTPMLRQVWSGREAGTVELVRNIVKKLHTKLGEDARKPTWMFNLRGVGYRMARPGSG